MLDLFKKCNDWMYHNVNCVDWNMEEYCWINGYWSWDDTVDADGNIVDSIKVITRKDLQEACDSLGIDIDCKNY